MILTGRKLEEFGRTLYGEVWVSVMSKKLKVAKRTVLRWKDDERAMPTDMQTTLVELIDDQIAQLGEKRGILLEDLDVF
jgi:hypothetical protein